MPEILVKVEGQAPTTMFMDVPKVGDRVMVWVEATRRTEQRKVTKVGRESVMTGGRHDIPKDLMASEGYQEPLVIHVK